MPRPRIIISCLPPWHWYDVVDHTVHRRPRNDSSPAVYPGRAAGCRYGVRVQKPQKTLRQRGSRKTRWAWLHLISVSSLVLGLDPRPFSRSRSCQFDMERYKQYVTNYGLDRFNLFSSIFLSQYKSIKRTFSYGFLDKWMSSHAPSKHSDQLWNASTGWGGGDPIRSTFQISERALVTRRDQEPLCTYAPLL